MRKPGKRYSTYASEEERQIIEKAARAARMSPSQYLKNCALRMAIRGESPRVCTTIEAP